MIKQEYEKILIKTFLGMRLLALTEYVVLINKILDVKMNDYIRFTKFSQFYKPIIKILLFPSYSISNDFPGFGFIISLPKCSPPDQ